MEHREETDRVRRYWDRAAGSYDRSMGFFERLVVADGREWVTSRALGDVLEIGIGTGRNLPFYLPDVRLTGVDLSTDMLERARVRAQELGREADLRLGDAEQLEFEASSFDTVVFSFALCSIPDDQAAVREATRVLRPGGRLVFIEHVRSPRRWVRAIELLLDFFTSRIQGDHLLREPLRHVRAERLEIEMVGRSKLGFIERAVARKPEYPHVDPAVDRPGDPP
jgi:ubiquinone/menaquinone biosynthesis C-methylase UbiE